MQILLVPEAIDAIRRGVWWSMMKDGRGRVPSSWQPGLPRRSGGVICARLTSERMEGLRLPQVWSDNNDAMQTAFTISVDENRNHE